MVRLVAGLAAAGLISATACGPPSSQANRPSPQTVAAAASPTPVASLVVTSGANFVGHAGPPRCPDLPGHTDNVVLAQDRLTYSTEEIGRIAAAAVDGGLVGSNSLDPSLLAVEPGAATDASGLTPAQVLSGDGSKSCLFEVDVTNTGRFAVQIPRVGIRLMASPVRNTAQYRLVEFCSVLQVTHYCGPQVGHGPQPCSVQYVDLSISALPAVSDLLVAPSAFDFDNSQPCPPVTLQPQASVTFVYGVVSNDPMIYHTVPILEVVAPTAQDTEAFPALAGVLVYADPSQFTCYRLSGTTFVQWKQGPGAYDLEGNALAGAWCA